MQEKAKAGIVNSASYGSIRYIFSSTLCTNCPELTVRLIGC